MVCRDGTWSPVEDDARWREAEGDQLGVGGLAVRQSIAGSGVPSIDAVTYACPEDKLALDAIEQTWPNLIIFYDSMNVPV